MHLHLLFRNFWSFILVFVEFATTHPQYTVSFCVLKYLFLNSPTLSVRRRQWHPTPVLLPGKSHGWRTWKAAVHGVAEGRTRLTTFTFTFDLHALEKEMATHSGVLAWRIPGTGEPGGLPSVGSHRVGHNWSDLAAAVVFCYGGLSRRQQGIVFHALSAHLFCTPSPWPLSSAQVIT